MEEEASDGVPSFGALLRKLRLARGLTQEELAERAGLSVRGISDLERGANRRARPDTFVRLAQALGLDQSERAQFDRLLHRFPARQASVAAPPSPQGITSESPSLATHHNLPVPLTRFIGREQAIADVRALVLGKRLVTLTGPGGIGKTSLAGAVAFTLTSPFVDGVTLVELAALADGELVTYTIAAALQIRERPDEPILTTLSAAIGMSQRLLVLDNCEHLLLTCARVAEALLRTCPRLTILATSREPMRVGGEVIWRVPSLATPPLDTETRRHGGAAGTGGVEGYEAVRLFVERAGAVRTGFTLTSWNAGAVAEICRRLDGIPLAIELAAARVGALSPEQIARLLNDRFGLLTRGNRTALPRHQTLRALFDWSYELLFEKERILLRRLAVFVGGWTLEAAQGVCGLAKLSPDAPVCRDEVLDLLLGLVDKSLVLVEERDGEARYQFLETVREYAREKLDASGETATIRAAHSAYFAAWVGGPDPLPVTNVIDLLLTPIGTTALGPAAAEMDNLRAALSWLLDGGDAEAGLGLAARIHHVWFGLGPREEGRVWLRRFLSLPSAATAPSRAAALYATGWLAQFQGDLAEAHAAYAESAALALARGDRRGRAYAQIAHAVAALMQGVPVREELEEGIRLAREMDNPCALLDGLANLGYLAIARGDLAGAREALTEGRAALPRYPVLRFRFFWLAGDLALAEGRGECAAREYRAALEDRADAGDPVGVSCSVLGLAEVAAAARERDRAARLLGGSEGIALGVGNRPIVWPVQHAQHTRVEATVRELLGDAAFATLRAEGQTMTLEDIVAYALDKDAG